MEFRTVIPAKRAPFSISHSEPVLLIGSCFTENIGRMMRGDLFPVTVNPSGVLYNPASIAKAIGSIIDNHPYTAGQLIFHNGVYHSMQHHSSFSSCNSDAVLEKINSHMTEAHQTLKNASTVIITFGTATAYRYRKTGEIAGNCHKIPQNEFDTVRLSVDDIVGAWKLLIDRVRAFNNSVRFIFTVSPIRYKAYGMHGSQLDKAVLLTAVDEIIRQFPDTAEYFPAYEIMLDDLRDYRFYDADMIHPSTQAVEYIYESFGKTFYTETTADLAKQCRKISRRLTHRFLIDDQDAIAAFRSETDEILTAMERMQPNIKELAQNFAKWHHSMQ